MKPENKCRGLHIAQHSFLLTAHITYLADTCLFVDSCSHLIVAFILDAAFAMAKTCVGCWCRYTKFVTSTVGSTDAVVPPTPNLTRYKRELAVKAEEATGRNSPKSAK